MPIRTIAVVFLFSALLGCTPAPPPPPPPVSEAEVQDFVRVYLAAYNSGDATKITSMITKDGSATSIGYGEITEGWESIRKVVDEHNAGAVSLRVTFATVTVQPVSADVALAFAPFTVTIAQRRGTVQLPGAATLIIRRSGGKLELMHEHYSTKLAE